MKLHDSQKRAIRTVYHAVIAALTAGPTIIPLFVSLLKGTPYAEKAVALGAVAIAWLGIVATVVNKAEDLGWLPALLRSVGEDATATPVAPAPAADPVAVPVATDAIPEPASEPATSPDPADPGAAHS